MQKKKVKIVCTIGPASESPAILRALIRNGMDVARLNFSHGTRAEHIKRIKTVRAIAEQEGCHIGVLQDIQGPKIRIETFQKGEVFLKAGQFFTITTHHTIGNEKQVSCSYKNLHRDVKLGHRILLDDGLICLQVKKIQGPHILTRVIFGGILKDRKGVNLPDTPVKISCLTSKDKEDIRFGLQHEVDFLALSFIQNASDILVARRLIQKSKTPPAIVAKIERAHAIQKIDEILEQADGIMVARGDLGVECPLEQVPGLQKQLIHAANKAGRFVITATQMLESMTKFPRPTRAEASDVANAVLDGTDAVMLSAETASGLYPVESVKTMSRIILQTEEYLSQTSRIHHRQQTQEHYTDVTMAITAAATKAVQALQASAVVAFTHSGTTAADISRLRPQAPICALTPFARTCRFLSIFWGVISEVIPLMHHTDEMIPLSKSVLKKFKMWKENSFLIFLSGTPVARPGSTNLLKIYKIK